MSSNESMKNKLVNTMRATKAGTASSTTETQKNEVPAKKATATKQATAKKKAPARKKATAKPVASSFSSGCRVWPD